MSNTIAYLRKLNFDNKKWITDLKQYYHTLSSSSGQLHSQDDKILTELDTQDYIEMYNSIIN